LVPSFSVARRSGKFGSWKACRRKPLFRLE
jgi:hypothetical protein